MSREIKYKAWDHQNKKWINLWQIRFALGGDVMAVTDIGGEQYGLHQVDLVEFTSMRDKNGAEIFEGDILKGGKYGPTIYICEFDNEAAGFEFKVLKDESGSFYNDASHNMEIIGNIYENGDLLKGGKNE